MAYNYNSATVSSSTVFKNTAVDSIGTDPSKPKGKPIDSRMVFDSISERNSLIYPRYWGMTCYVISEKTEFILERRIISPDEYNDLYNNNNWLAKTNRYYFKLSFSGLVGEEIILTFEEKLKFNLATDVRIGTNLSGYGAFSSSDIKYSLDGINFINLLTGSSDVLINGSLSLPVSVLFRNTSSNKGGISIELTKYI